MGTPFITSWERNTLPNNCRITSFGAATVVRLVNTTGNAHKITILERAKWQWNWFHDNASLAVLNLLKNEKWLCNFRC